jgi:prepilin-type N-terminal cleavage/methylation domain-containing protein
VFSECRDGGRNDRGFSLIEMLVASAIFAIAAAVAFILYTSAQKSYKAGENFTNQQQATRVAFDRMISDLRLAGFNTNPDGDTTRVDEQIEGAWDTAVTLRGDFDFEDPTASQTPESSLAGSVYNTVSTGNDEIVTYVLAKPGLASTGTMDLWVDADKPRVKSVKQVTIPKIALIQDNPPYTLYRVTLADIAGTFPTSPQASTNFVYEPIADNIKSMTFFYYDDGGTLLNPNTPADPTDDIGGSNANSATRAQIRRIQVSLVGMTQDSDLDYTDVTDASAATQHYRKFDLQSDVNPENLGKSGVKDVDVTPPPTPTNIVLVPGHCNGMLVKWDQPASSDGVSSYVVKYWPNGTPSAFATRSFTYPHYDYGTIDYLGHAFVPTLTAGASYCFQVQAKDSAGNQSGWGPATAPCAAVVTTAGDLTTPGTPTGLQATGNGTLAPQDSQITISWTQVKANANILTGDPNTIGGNTILRDQAGYQLYRDVTSGFSTQTLIADPTHPVTSPLTTGVTQFVDASVTNCFTYYYRLQTVDTCPNTSAYSAIASGQATTTIPPAKPTNLVATRSGANTVVLSWTAVTTNANGQPETVNLYKIYGVLADATTVATSIPLGSFTLRGTSTTTSYTDALSSSEKNALNSTYAMFYRVTAADLCPNESAMSDPAETDCRSTMSYLTTPASGSSGGGNQPIGMNWSGGTDTITRVRAHVPSLTGGSDVYDQTVYPVSGATSATLPTWNTTTAGPGAFTIYWEAENSRGCVKSWTTTFTVVANLACKITATNPNLNPVTGNPSNQYTKLAWDIQNNSGSDLFIDEIDVSWTNTVVCPTCPHKLLTIEYPTGTVATNFGTGATTKAQAFYLTALKMCGSSSGGCSPGPALNTQLTFSTGVGNGTTSETITVDYYFHDSTFTNGKCSLTVISGP